MNYVNQPGRPARIPVWTHAEVWAGTSTRKETARRAEANHSPHYHEFLKRKFLNRFTAAQTLHRKHVISVAIAPGQPLGKLSPDEENRPIF